MNQSGPIFSTETTQRLVFSKFLTLTYFYVAIGLALTFGIGFYIVDLISKNPQLYTSLAPWIIPITILELVLVAGISFMYKKVSAWVTGALFIFYSALNAVFFGVLLSLYELNSVITTFAVTSITFLIMSVFGYFTKSDLTKWGNIAFMGLIGIIIASVFNIFFANDTLTWIITYVGIAIFLVLIARDTQQLKEMSLQIEANGGQMHTFAIRGALALYLDLINLFIFLLRIFGSRD